MVRGTKIVLLAILWLIPICLFSLAFKSDWPTFWNSVLVPSWKGPFMDLGSITSAVKVQQRGGDPLIANSIDVYQRPMNYPRIWLHLFSWLGIKDSNVRTVGVSFCVLYLICISWLMAHSASGPEALILLIAGLSLAPLLAIERGNTDLLVFSLVFLGCVTANKYIKPGVFFCAALLKIFPFVALVIDAARHPAKERRIPIVFAGLAMILLAWQWGDLNAIRHSTPVSTYLSYGLLSLKAQAGYLSWSLFAAGCAIAVLIAGMTWLMQPNLNESALRSKSGEMFLVFAGIYAFTFVIGSNWNYRLIFLLPTLPFAIEMIRSTRHRKWGIAYIAAVLVAENSFALGTYEGIPLGDIATFIVFAMISAILLPLAMNFVLGGGAVFQSRAIANDIHDKVSV